MKRTILALGAALISLFSLNAQEKIDTIYLSTLYTTHIVFTTELSYADLSNRTVIAGKIVDQNKNMVAIKATSPFTTTASITALETNGTIHTFILAYKEHPKQLIIDTRVRREAIDQPNASEPSNKAKKGNTGNNVSTVRKSDAPELKDVIEYEPTLFHIAAKSQKVVLTVENIFAYSDITYVTLKMTNGSGVSYEVDDASFIIESRAKGKRKVVTEKNVFPKNRFGSLSCGAGEESRICYSLEKITLSKDQVLKIYIYEKDGQRNLALTLSPKDVNLAKNPLA